MYTHSAHYFTPYMYCAERAIHCSINNCCMHEAAVEELKSASDAVWDSSVLRINTGDYLSISKRAHEYTNNAVPSAMLTLDFMTCILNKYTGCH